MFSQHTVIFHIVLILSRPSVQILKERERERGAEIHEIELFAHFYGLTVYTWLYTCLYHIMVIYATHKFVLFGQKRLFVALHGVWLSYRRYRLCEFYFIFIHIIT